MKKSLVCLSLLFTLSAVAQKKELSYEQIFSNAPTHLIRPLPEILRWIDDEHYLERRDDQWLAVEARTGKTTPYHPATTPGDHPVTPPGKTVPGTPDLPAGAQNATPSPDGKWIAYTKENDLFTKEIATGKILRFTHDGSPNIYNGYAAYVYYEEILHHESHYKAFWWSPDSKHIAFIRFDETKVPVFPIYNAEGQHGFLEHQHYPMAGDPNPKVRTGFVSVENPLPVWADFNEDDDQYFHTPYWTPDGSALWVQWMGRRQDELKIFSVDPLTGKKKEVYTEKQKTWVLEKFPYFLKDGKHYLLISDQTGWGHIYIYTMEGNLVNRVPTGNFSVNGIIQVDEDNKIIYFLARKENSTRTDFYKIGFDGKNETRLSFGNYTHDNILLSPNNQYFITTYSNLSTPARTALVDNKGQIIRELGDSRDRAFEGTQLAKIELLRVRSRDSLFDLPLKIIYPLHFDPSHRYPVLINIYGGPYLGSIYDQWSLDLRSQWWAKEGLVQVVIDNRSSGHFGKAGMDYIYGQMGKYEIEDFIDGARWLRSQSFIDTTRVGVYGYSFGGFMTCMALTYGAGVFNYGISYYPVTDWRLYDSYYTEKFMGLPKDNPEGYKIASPITYADNYKGLLRIIHGDMDNNVHMQNTIQFTSRLEDLNKHFELLIYHGQRHGRGSWDINKRTQSYHEDFQFIYDHLLQRPMPEIFWR